jgi:diaminopimelate decarboxylase
MKIKDGLRGRYMNLSGQALDESFLMDIAREHGTPLYLFFKSKIIERYKIFQEVSAKYFRDFSVAYSYKANRLYDVCSTFKGLSAMADVLSDLELNVAEKVGLDPAMIIFNSPYKTDEEIRRSIEMGIGSLNIDSLEELKRVELLVERANSRLNVGIRIRPRIPHLKAFALPAHFGLDREDLLKAVAKIRENRKLHFTQIHSHIGTQITELNAFRQNAAFLDETAAFLEERGIEVPALNVGGGYPLKETPSLLDPHTPDLDDVMQEIRRGVKGKRHIIFEPGRFLVGPAGLMLTKVVSVKKDWNGNQLVVVDASLYFINSASYVSHRIIPVGVDGAGEETDVYGSSCASIDLIKAGADLPKLKEGDLLAIMDCGAYSVFLAPRFHRERPKILFVDEKGLREVKE